jgi:heat shock protein HtpX
MKRIVLFLVTNLAVVAVISVVLKVLGLDRAVFDATGVNYGALLAFSFVVGFTGAIISLLMSKSMAKMSTGAHVIEQPRDQAEAWLVDTVKRLADRAGIGMPEVAIYDGPPNAFATGAFKNSALVAVSTGLLQSMNKEEVEAVLGHEIAHVANGDMVTMTLIQGVVNTFVVFFSRVIASLVSRGNDGRPGPAFFAVSMVLQIVFGILASIIVAWFSRQREFRADRGAATYLGSPTPMVNALRRLGAVAEEASLPAGIKTLGITDKSGIMALFSTHPPIEQRIAALQGARGE